MAIPVEQRSSLELEVSGVVAEMLEAFAATGDGGADAAASGDALARYQRRVARIGMAAGRFGLTGLQDTCVELQDRLRALKRRGTGLSAEERELLEEWPLLVMGYINAPHDPAAAQALVDFLQRPAWGEPVSPETGAEIRSALGSGPALPALPAAGDDPRRDGAGGHDAAVAGDGTGGLAGLGGPLREEVEEAMSDCLLRLAEPGVPPEEARAALTHCAERLELLAMTAATAGLAGFMDACQIFQAGLRRLAAAGRAPATEELDALYQWAGLVGAWLEAPHDPARAEALVDFLRALPWGEPVDEDQAAILRGLLAPEEIHIDAPAGEPPPEIPPAYRELVGLLLLELEQSQPELESALAAAAGDGTPAEDRHAAWREVLDRLERFAGAAATLGLHGLAEACGHVHACAEFIDATGEPLAPEQHRWFADWPRRARAYLETLVDPAACTALADHLGEADWGCAPDAAARERLVQSLARPEIALEEEELAPRQAEARDEDVSLALPDDVNPQLLDSLLQELPRYTADFSAAITRLAEGDGTRADVETAQRIAHTLKGSANTVGVAGLANLTHHMEDILEAHARAGRLPPAPLVRVLQSAADVLEMMSEALLGQGEAPAHAREVLQEVLDWANRMDLEGVPEDAPAAPEPEPAPAADTPAAEAGPVLRIPARLVDELLRRVGESLILTAQLRERLGQAAAELAGLRERNELLGRLTQELEQLVDVQGIHAGRGREAGGEFDALELEQYNALHTVTHRLVEAVADSREMGQGMEEQLGAFDGLLADQSRLQKETEELVMETRMVPVQNLVPRLQRAVRQTCRLTGRDAVLEVSGADTLIDSQVLDQLADPLLHLLRNAVDHGIEPPDRRAAAGKPERGRIRLAFRREGDHMVVCCEDDGAGLDREAILERARARGLVGAEETPADEALHALVLVPGFSTREEVSQVSGRGVGMDVVNTRVREMKGTLRLHSEPGRGCRVEMRLPLTLISVHALLVAAGAGRVALSSRGVERIVYGGDGRWEAGADGAQYCLGDECHAAFELEALLGLPAPATDAEPRPVLLVRDHGGLLRAVRVARVLASQDLVVKQMGPYMPRVPGLDGATILGDGTVAPVLDLPAVLAAARSDGLPAVAPAAAEAAAPPRALVVDDSLSARRSLAQFVADLGYEVHTARDGLEAIELLDRVQPELLLVDLEMPRMNGLELTAHVRADDTHRHLPVIMITSRSTDKHRRQAERAGVDRYLTKPFSEDELLGHIAALAARPPARLNAGDP